MCFVCVFMFHMTSFVLCFLECQFQNQNKNKKHNFKFFYDSGNQWNMPVYWINKQMRACPRIKYAFSGTFD